MVRVGVLRGGTNHEYDISLRSGAAVLEAIRNELQDSYQAVDVLVSRDGEWFISGRKIPPEHLGVFVDCVWNSLHGGQGENGDVAELCAQIGLPMVGASRFAGAQTLDKARTKEVAESLGIKTPRSLTMPDFRNTEIDPEEYIDAVVRETTRTMAPPWVVKPIAGGSSEGVYFTFTTAELEEAVVALMQAETDIIIEEYLDGREVVAGGIRGFRGKEWYNLIPVETMRKGPILDAITRKEGKHSFIPFRREVETDEELTRAVEQLAKELDLPQYATADFIMTPRGLYLVEVDAQPALDEHSPLRAKLELVGAKFSEFVGHVLGKVTGK